jgi:glutamate racemase
MEPAVKPAVTATRSGVVGVLATTGTLRSAQFAALLESYGKNVRVVTQGCPGLVECVERGELDSAQTRELLEGYVAPLLAAGADTLVLGCTHYPFLRSLLAELVGDSVALIDTGAAVARQVERRLNEMGIRNAEATAGTLRFWTSGDAVQGQKVVEMLWGAATVEPLPR